MVWFRWQSLFRIVRKRYLFNTYLLLGSLSIVVATTMFTIKVSRSVERQSILTTELLSKAASRLFEAESLDEVAPIFEMVNEIEVPFIMTDNSGRPILWNEPVIGIPVLDREILLNEDIKRPNNPVVQEILSLAAA